MNPFGPGCPECGWYDKAEAYRAQLEAVTRERDRLLDIVERGYDVEARRARDTALERERRLIEALRDIDFVVHDCDPDVSSEVYSALAFAGNAAREVLAQDEEGTGN